MLCVRSELNKIHTELVNVTRQQNFRAWNEESPLCFLMFVVLQLDTFDDWCD